MCLELRKGRYSKMRKFEMYIWTYEDGGYFEYYRDILAESYAQAYEKAKVSAKRWRFYDFDVREIEGC